MDIIDTVIENVSDDELNQALETIDKVKDKPKNIGVVVLKEKVNIRMKI